MFDDMMLMIALRVSLIIFKNLELECILHYVTV